jgi:adenylate kinase
VNASARDHGSEDRGERDRPVHLALLGKPGSGKGTQGAMLARRLGLPLVSIGELLRRRAAEQTPTSRDLAAKLNQGDLVPDEQVLMLVRDALDELGDGGYILDGFPRTIGQARSDAVPIDAVVHLDLPDDDARERLEGRVSSGRTDDADLDAVGRRLQRYHADTEPLVDLYRGRGMLTTVDATASPANVTSRILDALGIGGRPADEPQAPRP